MFFPALPRPSFAQSRFFESQSILVVAGEMERVDSRGEKTARCQKSRNVKKTRPISKVSCRRVGTGEARSKRFGMVRRWESEGEK